MGKRERGRSCHLGKKIVRKELRLESENKFPCLGGGLEGGSGQGLSLKGTSQTITPCTWQPALTRGSVTLYVETSFLWGLTQILATF